MDLEQRLMEDMKTAMKSRDKIRLETIRGLRAQLKNVQIEKGDTLNEEDVLKVLNSAAKKRREVIEQFRALGRDDRADVEQRELEVIAAYLPEQMDKAAVTKLIEETIARVNAESMKDMGKVMGAIMGQVKGKADGKMVQQIVREKLSAV